MGLIKTIYNNVYNAKKICTRNYEILKTINFNYCFIALFFFLSCDNDNNNNNEPSSIEIGNYIFNFETEFTLEQLQGIDSYVGNVNGSGITLSFDYD